MYNKFIITAVTCSEALDHVSLTGTDNPLSNNTQRVRSGELTGMDHQIKQDVMIHTCQLDVI